MNNSAPIASTSAVVFNGSTLTLESIGAIAKRQRPVQLERNGPFEDRIRQGAALVERILDEDGVIYGVTTGYGDSCTTVVPPELVPQLPHHLYTYHGIGAGRLLDDEETRAVLACRLASLSQGASGVSWPLLEQIEAFLQHDILPCIPAEGSVGASGDLTPLSYLAAALCAERDVRFAGETMPASQALAKIGRAPLQLRPKEALALMNGTAVMTALACLAWLRTEQLLLLSCRITACNIWAMNGNAYHYNSTLFAYKPHVGPQSVAARLRADLQSAQPARNDHRLQDRYSLRCAPHVIGAVEDAMPWLQAQIQNELNSANDNPLIDVDTATVLHGGHFYGGHIAMAMDTLKAGVANIADLLDRQLALLVDSRFNNGLPSNLSGAQGARSSINHGLKALQISASAWTAEALKNTMPASVFSRSTECHNQDKVSMGTIAARDALRTLELTEQVVAAMLIAARQSLQLRLHVQQHTPMPQPLEDFLQQLTKTIAFITEDRALDTELQQLLAQMRQGYWRPQWAFEAASSEQ
ncbi:aromatic amino acid lyase [Lampropedia puyangensis]|uniref:tyrosine ammonia-lyase n=1 Tax=Lampropedia puyangensis TaxID=1330072 RepID=A0A4S8FAH3_9BURK|nr:aromatic amino acid ammonia-lyase [Lampropedia puyangensis]THU02582.1 aromatic amino acid lyase [Lampropedia puyangensis]